MYVLRVVSDIGPAHFASLLKRDGGNAGTVQGTVKLSHPSHGSLEDADAAGVSHISRALDGWMYLCKDTNT